MSIENDVEFFFELKLKSKLFVVVGFCCVSCSSAPSRKRSRPTSPTKQLIQPLSTLMKNSLQSGLNTNIDQNSIGFQLLSKMGYKVGKGIGKTETGRIEPIEIDLEQQRSGLGRQRMIKEQQKRKIEQLIEQQTAVKDNFHQHTTSKFQLKQLQQDIQKAIQTCRTLDETHNITSNPLWSSVDESNSNNESDSTSYTAYDTTDNEIDNVVGTRPVPERRERRNEEEVNDCALG